MASFCYNCGAPLDEDSIYCKECGVQNKFETNVPQQGGGIAQPQTGLQQDGAAAQPQPGFQQVGGIPPQLDMQQGGGIPQPQPGMQQGSGIPQSQPGMQQGGGIPQSQPGMHQGGGIPQSQPGMYQTGGIPQPSPPQQGWPPNSPLPDMHKKRSKAPLIAIISAVCVVALAVVLIVTNGFGLFDKDGDNSNVVINERNPETSASASQDASVATPPTPSTTGEQPQQSPGASVSTQKPPETTQSGTEPPETYPPETEPTETAPPETEPPEMEPPETEPPETEPPETEPPETEPPETEPPDVETTGDTQGTQQGSGGDADDGEGDGGQSNTDNSIFGRLTEDILQTILSGTFYIKMEAPFMADMAMVIDFYMKGDMTAIVIDSDSFSYRGVLRDGKSYYILDDLKIVMVSDIPAELDMVDMVNASESVYVGEGSGDFNGKTLNYDEYVQSDGSHTFYFVDGESFVGMRYVMSDGTVNDVPILAFSKNVPNSVFEIPQDYAISDLQQTE